MTEISSVIELLEAVRLDLAEIKDRLRRVEERLDQIGEETQKMDQHVDFVEQVYQQVKSPFYQIMSMVSGSSYLVDQSKTENYQFAIKDT